MFGMHEEGVVTQVNGEAQMEKCNQGEKAEVRLNWWLLAFCLLIISYLPALHHRGISLRMVGGLEVGHAGIQPHSLFVVLLIVLVINPLLKKFGGRMGISRGTTIAMYIVLGAGGIAVANFQYLELILVQLQYRISIAPPLYGDMIDSVSRLLIPTDPDAVKAMYVGDAAVPWAQWFWPIVLWSSLNFAMVVALTCIGILVRRRWMDIDRLVFPWAQPVLQMTKEPEKEGALLGEFWRNGRMWAGFAVGFLVLFLELAHERWLPWLPYIPRRNEYLKQLIAGYPALSPISQSMSLEFNFIPTQIGLFFLVPVNYLFSIWMFVILKAVIALFWGSLGLMAVPGIGVNSFHALGYGGFIVLGLAYMYMVRGDVRDLWRVAFRGGDLAETSEREGMSIRFAFIGLLVTMVFIVAFGTVLLNINIALMLGWVLIMFAGCITAGRGRSEALLPDSRIPFANLNSEFIGPFLGGSTLGVANTLGLGYLQRFSQTTLNGIIPFLLEGFKLGDDSGLRRRDVTRLVLLATAVASVFGLIWPLVQTYQVGINATGWWAFQRPDGWLTQPALQVKLGLAQAEAQPVVRTHFVIGSVVTAFLFKMTTSYVWWPLHPMGFLLAMMHPTQYFITLNAFLAWLFKILILRYSGAGGYKRAIPFFLGIAVGAQCIAVLRTILQIITGV